MTARDSKRPNAGVDTKLFPLVRVTLLDYATDRDFRELLAQLSELVYGDRGRYALLIDARGFIHLPSAEMRRVLGQWQKEHREAAAQVNVCSAVVMNSTLVRRMLIAVNWFSPPPSPQRYAASMLEGLDFCVEHLRAAGEKIPHRIEAYRQQLSTEATSPPKLKL